TRHRARRGAGDRGAVQPGHRQPVERGKFPLRRAELDQRSAVGTDPAGPRQSITGRNLVAGRAQRPELYPATAAGAGSTGAEHSGAKSEPAGADRRADSAAWNANVGDEQYHAANGGRPAVCHPCWRHQLVAWFGTWNYLWWQ